VDDVRQAQLPQLADIKPQVLQQMQQQQLSEYQRGLREKAKVE
jgi:peptidyl-prolyl cis-trans isomerase C